MTQILQLSTNPQWQFNHCKKMKTQNYVCSGKPVEPYSKRTTANLKHTNEVCKFCRLNNIITMEQAP